MGRSTGAYDRIARISAGAFLSPGSRPVKASKDTSRRHGHRLGGSDHAESCTISVLSTSGKRLRRDVVPTDAAALGCYFKGLEGELHVCMEEVEWSEWLTEILAPYVVELVSVPGAGCGGVARRATGSTPTPWTSGCVRGRSTMRSTATRSSSPGCGS